MAVTVDIAPAFSRSVGNGGRLVGYNHADSVSLLYFPSDLGPAQNTWNMYPNAALSDPPCRPRLKS